MHLMLMKEIVIAKQLNIMDIIVCTNPYMLEMLIFFKLILCLYVQARDAIWCHIKSNGHYRFNLQAGSLLLSRLYLQFVSYSGFQTAQQHPTIEYIHWWQTHYSYTVSQQWSSGYGWLFWCDYTLCTSSVFNNIIDFFATHLQSHAETQYSICFYSICLLVATFFVWFWISTS